MSRIYSHKPLTRWDIDLKNPHIIEAIHFKRVKAKFNHISKEFIMGCIRDGIEHNEEDMFRLINEATCVNYFPDSEGDYVDNKMSLFHNMTDARYNKLFHMWKIVIYDAKIQIYFDDFISKIKKSYKENTDVAQNLINEYFDVQVDRHLDSNEDDFSWRLKESKLDEISKTISLQGIKRFSKTGYGEGRNNIRITFSSTKSIVYAMKSGVL